MNFKNKLIMIVLAIFIIGVIGGIASVDAATHSVGTKKYNVKLTQKEYKALNNYEIKYKTVKKTRNVTKTKSETKTRNVTKNITIIRNYSYNNTIDFRYNKGVSFHQNNASLNNTLNNILEEYPCNILELDEGNQTNYSIRTSSLGNTMFIYLFVETGNYTWFKKYTNNENNNSIIVITNTTINVSECQFQINKNPRVGYFRTIGSTNMSIEINSTSIVEEEYLVNETYTVQEKYNIKVPYKVRKTFTLTKTIPNKYVKVGLKKYPIKMQLIANNNIKKGYVLIKIFSKYLPVSKMYVRIR